MRKAKLGDLCEFKPSKRLARIGLSASDPVSFVPMSDLGIGRKYLNAGDERPLSEVAGSYTYFADGDVLLAKITPCFENGKLGIAQGLTNGVGFGSSEFTVIRPGPDVLAEYVYYFLARDEVRERGAKVMTGAVGHKRVPQEFVEDLEIPLPPLEEQRRIVAMLDEAFSAIATATDNAEKNLANVRELPGNLIEAVLSSEPDQRVMTLIDVVDPTCTLSYGIVQPGDEVDGGLPIVRPVDLQQGVVGLEGLKRIDPKIATSYERTTLRGDEILLCVRGTTGTISVASPELAGGNVTRGIVPIRFDPAVVSRAFGHYLMRSAAVQKQIRAATYGAALMQINIRDLKKLAVRIPSLRKQAALSERLDRLNAELALLQEAYAQKLAALTQLNQSLLRRAFSGELTKREPLAA